MGMTASNNADDQDRVIAACTRFLNDRGESQGNRAGAYNDRGIAWHDKGDLDRAIADYNEAIRLNPKTPRPTTTAALPGATRVT